MSCGSFLEGKRESQNIVRLLLGAESCGNVTLCHFMADKFVDASTEGSSRLERGATSVAMKEVPRTGGSAQIVLGSERRGKKVFGSIKSFHNMLCSYE